MKKAAQEFKLAFTTLAAKAGGPGGRHQQSDGSIKLVPMEPYLKLFFLGK